MSETTDKEPSSTDRLRRNVAAGMDPTFLQTAFVGADNKRIKHRVHRGALHLPPDVLAKYDPPQKEYELPAVGSVTRPSLDDSRKIVVAQVRYEERLEDVVVDGLTQKRPVSRILITNEFLKQPETKRIRGGGDEPAGAPGSSAATPMEIDEASPSNSSGSQKPNTNNVSTAETPRTTTDLKGSGADADPQVTQAPISKQPQDTKIPIVNPSNTSSATPPPLPATSNKLNPEAAISVAASLSSTSNASAAEKQQLPVVSSSNTDGKTESKPEGPKLKDPKVVPLSNTPKSQWEQRKPTKDEVPLETPGSSSKPDWYRPNEASEFEKVILPEWFDESSKHRTAESYVQVREKILFMASELGANRFLTGTMVRRAIAGDAASLLRLHNFLSSNGLINEQALNDTQPALKLLHKSTTASTRESVVKAVIQQIRSKKQSDGSRDSLDVNWDAIASMVGDGMTAAACEQTFKEMTNGTTSEGGSMAEVNSSLSDLIAKCNPSVLQAAIVAALNKSDDFGEARNAASVASIVQQANAKAESHEMQLAHIMGRALDSRMKRLESRLDMIEEVEGMLDAERMSLNLERRDLYTARCRSWFNGT